MREQRGTTNLDEGCFPEFWFADIVQKTLTNIFTGHHLRMNTLTNAYTVFLSFILSLILSVKAAKECSKIVICGNHFHTR